MCIHTFIHTYMHLVYWIFCVGSYLYSSIGSSNVLLLKPFWFNRSNLAIVASSQRCVCRYAGIARCQDEACLSEKI